MSTRSGVPDGIGRLANVTGLRPSELAGRLGRIFARGFPWSAPAWPVGLERPAPDRRLGVDYDTSWARAYPARLARAVMTDNLTRPLMHALATPTVRGEEVLDECVSPTIFVANHSSHIDTGLLVSILPARLRHRTVVAAAADHFFDRRWKAHLWAFALGAIPIERHRVNRRSAALATDLVDDGWNLIIFPEGGRTPDGWLQPFRGGAAYVAAHTGRPVVPAYISGTRDILAKGSSRLRRNPVTVTFGRPLWVEPGEGSRHFERRIEEAVASLADEATSDFFSARRRAYSAKTPSQRGPDASPWRRAWALAPRVPAQPGGNNHAYPAGMPHTNLNTPR
ncbi:MAG: lysophospholipid acyltransferase family protein [Acidimicrobiales bacterium]